MPHVWRVINSFFGGEIPVRITLPKRIPVVALLVDEQDRRSLSRISGDESLDVHFAESCQDAAALAQKLTAPIILLDRDWPESEWKSSAASLASSRLGACIILVSAQLDGSLWQELIRSGGYDVLAKPLRPEKVARIVKLALSYWTSATRQAVTARRARGVKLVRK